jgi:hypothetical protein
MRSRLAPVLLTLGGLLHLGTLVVLSLPGSTRPVTRGDIAFLIGVGALYLVAARAVAQQRWWGRWLGLAVSGVEAIPGVVLLYIVVVFSADPANQRSLGHFGFLALLLAPFVVFVVLWRHGPHDPARPPGRRP